MERTPFKTTAAQPELPFLAHTKVRWWLCALALVVACGDGDPPQGAEQEPSEDPALDYEVFDVEWRQDAVIVDDLAAVQGALMEADYEAGEFLLSSALAEMDAVSAGDAILLAGIGVFFVEQAAVEGDAVRLTVRDAQLTDIIEEGTIEWRRSFVSAQENRKIGLGPGQDDTDSIARLRQPLSVEYNDGNFKFAGKIGDFDTSFDLKHTYPKLEMSLQSKAKSGKAVVNAAAKATITGLTNETKIEIKAHELTNFSVKFLDVEGEVEIEAGAVEVTLGDTKVVIPGRMSLPVVLGGIPFSIDLGGSIEWQSTLKANASARFKGKASFKGGVGVLVEDGQPTPLATFTHSTAETVESEQVGTIQAGLGFLLNFPELSVGVGVAKIAKAGAAFKFKTEVLTNVDFKYEAAGPAPVITDFCLKSKTNFGATLEKEVTLIGFTFKELDKSTSLFAKFGKEKTAGGACK